MACWSSIEGTRSYKELIGSKFRLKSVPISINGVLQKKCNLKYSQMSLTLKDVYFRVSTDGKVYTLFRMEEVCGKLFLPRDLELIEINRFMPGSTRCGEFVCGRILVGTGVEPENNLDNPEVEDEPTDNIITSTPKPILPNPEEGDEELDEDDFDGDGYIYDIIDNWEIISL